MSNLGPLNLDYIIRAKNNILIFLGNGLVGCERVNFFRLLD